MGVPVTIDDPDDVKYAVLGGVAGYNAFEACGRMARLWSYCTGRQAYVLSKALVLGFLGERGIEAIVTSEFGELVEDGIRIRGAEGRFEWYADAYLRKEAKRAGGKARAAQAARAGGRFVAGSAPADDHQHAHQQTTSSHQQPPAAAGPAGGNGLKASVVPAADSPAATSRRPADHQQPPAGDQQTTSSHQLSDSDLDLVSETQKSQPARARDPGVAQPATRVPEPPGGERVPPPPPVNPSDVSKRRGEILRAIAPLHADTYNRVRREIGSDAVALQPVGDVHETALRELLKTLAVLDGVEDRCRRVLEVRAAEARRTGSVQYLGASVWHPTSYARALSTSSDEASAGPAPRDSTTRAPPTAAPSAARRPSRELPTPTRRPT